jgi:release factor glutamine methyltransferase
VRRLDLYLQFDRPLSEAERDAVRTLVRGRGEGRPVAYLVGAREFHAHRFAVDPRVLIPRPETEHVVDVAIEALRAEAAPRFADVGVGSGAIVVSVLAALPAARADATDVSTGALAVARANAESIGVLDRLTLHEGDLLEPLRGAEAWGALDAVLANPPYVVRGDPTVAADVRENEPELALYVPGADALHFFRRIAEAAREALRPAGLLAMEVGAGSAPEGEDLLRGLRYAEVRSVRDLAGIDRVVTGRRG